MNFCLQVDGAVTGGGGGELLRRGGEKKKGELLSGSLRYFQKQKEL